MTESLQSVDHNMVGICQEMARSIQNKFMGQRQCLIGLAGPPGSGICHSDGNIHVVDSF